MNLSTRRVVLGVSGGIASYKACTVARRLTQAGATVDVVLTASGAEFVRPVTFEALTGRPVLTSLWDRDRALDHIRLAQDPDLIIVAPATANLIARAAQGLATDALSAILAAATAPVLFAPAMNDRMFANPATAKNIRILEERGHRFVGPASGDLAEGPSENPGRMSEPEEIIVEAERILCGVGALAGRRVVVTAGPTREALDPVRMITNRSSGLMGYELARAAYASGADVVLISGPTALERPPGPEVVSVDSTRDLQEAVGKAVRDADVLIMAAAPADYRPVETSAEKMARSNGARSVDLESTPDVLLSTAPMRKENCFCVGFALETGEGLERAREKMTKKKLNMIVFNRADVRGVGMESSDNEVVIISNDSSVEVPRTSKRSVAERILAEIEKRV